MLSVKNTSVFFRFFALPFIPFFVVCVLLSFSLFGFPVFSYNAQTTEGVPKEIKLAHKSVWKISWSDSDTAPSGTGFFVGENHFITNFHVIYPILKNIEHIILSQNGNPMNLKVTNILALSAVHDLALVEVETKHFTNFLSLRENLPEPYEDLYVPAYPKNRFTNIKKTGNIFFHGTSHLSFAVNHSPLPGISGSPVLDKQGQVVAVSFGGNHNILFALSMGDLKEFIIGNTGSNCAHFINLKSCAKKEIENLKDLATAGFVEAQHQLATYYHYGVIEKNGDKALQWWSKAAEQAYAPAQYQLAVMYYYGKGTKQDWDKALQWFSKAAEQAYALAQHGLARMYYYGEGTEKNGDKAFQWFSKAAEQAYAPAQYDLAMMYFYGKGTEKNGDKAFQWFSKAAKQAYAPAQYGLAMMYYYGEGTKKNGDKAFQWFSKAAELDYAPAQYQLAVIYYNGEGTEKNWDKAVQWFSKAAEQAYAPAQYQLAVMYYNGEGTEKNWDKAVQWLSKAAELDYAPAQHALALIGNK